jgi:RNA polymerase sigma-70 factor (ECF subfamily)
MEEKESLKIDIDADAVHRCAEGDLNAFEEIVIRYQKKMFNIAYRMTGDYHEAAEVVQDAFVSAYKNIKGFRGASKFSTWLFTIVMNLSRNRIKQMRRRSAREGYSLDDPVDTEQGEVSYEHPSPNPSVLERLETDEVQQAVQTCINALDTEFREVLVLRDIQGFSYGEIGGLLHVSEGTVKSRIHRAREAVKNCLKNLIGKLT